jgi:hypothetical protein
MKQQPRRTHLGFARSAFGAAALLLTISVSASLLGVTVDCAVTGTSGDACADHPGQLFGTPASATVVSPGVEFFTWILGIGNLFSIDLDSDTITISLDSPGGGVSGVMFGPASGYTLVLSKLDDSVGPLQSFSLATFGNVNGFTTSAISLSADSVSVLFSGISFDFPHDPSIDVPPSAVITLMARAVPEPATLALLGAGLAGIGFSRRKR